jgi:phenylacetate-CoA ligase
MADTECACGRGLPRLTAVEGRALDALRAADGRTVPGEFISALLMHVPEIARFRVEQESVDRLVIQAVMARPLSERSETLLRREMQRAFGSGTVCELRPVTHIPPLSSGKRRLTVGMGA